MLVVLLDSPRDVTTLTVTDDVVVQPPPVGRLPLLFVLRPDVLHHVELPLVFLVTESTLEHGANVGAEVDLEIPEDHGLEGALGALVVLLPWLGLLLLLPHAQRLAGGVDLADSFARLTIINFQIGENISEGLFIRFL